jgi:hypothetical protein
MDIPIVAGFTLMIVGPAVALLGLALRPKLRWLVVLFRLACDRSGLGARYCAHLLGWPATWKAPSTAGRPAPLLRTRPRDSSSICRPSWGHSCSVASPALRAGGRSGKQRADLGVLGEAALLLLREDELGVPEHVELALRALLDLRLVLGLGVQLGRETRGPRVVAVSDGAVLDQDARHGENLAPRRPPASTGRRRADGAPSTASYQDVGLSGS